MTKKIDRVYLLFKRSVFLFLITGSLFLPFLYYVSPSLDFQSKQPLPTDLQSPPSGTFGPFSVSWFSQNDDKRNLRIAFDRLSVSNGSAGLFKTALFQTLQLTNLRLYTNTDTIDQAEPVPSTETAGRTVDPMHLSPQMFTRILRQQQSNAANELNWSVPDLGRAANINIRGFTWQIADSSTILTVTSKLALLDHKQPAELLLKGHVILQSPDRVIESNQVVYDMQARRFQIPGSCMLTVNKEKILQRNIVLDISLNFDPPLAAQSKGENICLSNPSR